MLEVKKKQLLLVNMEYTQDEVNEPINIDVLLQYFPAKLYNDSNITIVYRDSFQNCAIALERYDIILISTKISSFHQVCNLLEVAKGKIIIVGGILAICAAEELARTYPNVVFNTGEAETNISSLLQLAYEAQTTEDFKQAIISSKISNICFYYEPHKNIYCSKRQVCELKNQQYPQHNKVRDVIAKEGLVRMETSRGCPWNKCSFCIMPWKFCGETWRSFSNTKIEEEINYLIKNGATRILFTDEDFIGNYEHLCNLCSIINRCTLSSQQLVSFGGSTSVLTLLKLGNRLDTCLQKMQDAGISLIFIGVESGCDSQLLRYNKGVTASMNEKLIAKLLQYKFEIDFGFIMFDADTTMDELEKNLDFIQRTGLRSTVSRFAKKLRVTPHTELYRNYLARGIITSDLDINELYYEYNFCDPTVELICSYLEKLDKHILEESYHLQAITRSTMIQEEKKLAHERLLFLRESEYIFLRQCVDCYKKKQSLLIEDMREIYQKCLGGVCNGVYQ